MIPAAGRAWRRGPAAPLSGLHPATTLGGGLLAALSALLLPLPYLAPLVGALLLLLWRAGWQPAALAARWRLWTPLLLVVLSAHALTAVDIAPLGRPTWIGLGRGAVAAARLAAMLAAVALTMRLLPLPALSAALAWWLRPLRRLGLDQRHLDLALAVAAGTVPRTLDEAARLEACLRLRCAGGARRRGFGLRERWLVVPPLMEGLVRRAESLPLALVGRCPQPQAPAAAMPWPQALLLVAWGALMFVALR